YLGGGFQPISKDQQSNWLDSLIDLTGNNRRFIISENSKPIGMIGLYSINWIHRTCEVGIYIGEKTKHGMGYGETAYKLIEKYAYNYLNLRKIKLFVVYENVKALNYWKKLGFENIGVLKNERYIDGQYHDLVIMDKTLNNWRKI